MGVATPPTWLEGPGRPLTGSTRLAPAQGRGCLAWTWGRLTPTMTRTLTIAVAAGVTIAGAAAAAAQPLPQPKVGQCPSGYRESGGYCAPTRDRAPAAVPKVGQCPSGYAQSGAYCVEMRRR
jgi:hypothetical protein